MHPHPTPPHPGVFGYLMQWRSHLMGVPIQWERPFIGKMWSVHIAPTFPFIDALFFGTPIKWERPFIVKSERCNLPQDGGKLHQPFRSSERPLDGNGIALDGNAMTLDGNAHSSGTPSPSLNAGGATFPPAGGKLHRLFHSSERPLIGTPNRWERRCIR